MARRTSQGIVDAGSTLPSGGTAQPDLPPIEAWGREQPRPATREIPLTERRMVLYATRPKTLSPADPCNKVACGQNWQIQSRSGNLSVESELLHTCGPLEPFTVEWPGELPRGGQRYGASSN